MLYQILASTTHGKKLIELPDGPYFVSGTYNYLKYVIKLHEAVTDNPQTNKTENRITFKIKTGYYLKLLIP